MLRAGAGDAILVVFRGEGGERRVILIDGGHKTNEYKSSLRPTIEGLVGAGQPVDLVVVTHYDNDHIKGIRWMMRDIRRGSIASAVKVPIGEIWFNGEGLARKVIANGVVVGDIGRRDARALTQELMADDGKVVHKHTIAHSPRVSEISGAKITVIAPLRPADDHAEVEILDIARPAPNETKSLASLMKDTQPEPQFDSSPSNASSIVVLLEHVSKKYLFLGDSTPAVLDPALEAYCQRHSVGELVVDAVKLSHHGSVRNISNRFLSLVKTQNYLISSDGSHHHPSKATFAKIILARSTPETLNFYFNYKEAAERLRFTEHEQRMHNFKIHTPEGKSPIRFIP